MKKTIVIITAVILAVLFALTLCACNDGLSESDWKAVGLQSSTLKLPELEISDTKSSTNKNSVMLSILWNGGSEETFNALANECFTKIPANKDEKSNVVDSISDLISSDSDKKGFNAKYKEDYVCSVIYFTEDCTEDGVTYKKGQILLVLQKLIEQVGTKYSWSIDSDDKTWFTEEELTTLGLVGLEAPQGTILGKIVSQEGNYVRMSIEISSDDIYDAFIKKLFDEYNMNTTVMQEVASSYKDDFIFRQYDEKRAVFMPIYKVQDKTFESYIALDDGHIVIEISSKN